MIILCLHIIYFDQIYPHYINSSPKFLTSCFKNYRTSPFCDVQIITGVVGPITEFGQPSRDHILKETWQHFLSCGQSFLNSSHSMLEPLLAWPCVVQVNAVMADGSSCAQGFYHIQKAWFCFGLSCTGIVQRPQDIGCYQCSFCS